MCLKSFKLNGVSIAILWYRNIAQNYNSQYHVRLKKATTVRSGTSIGFCRRLIVHSCWGDIFCSVLRVWLSQPTLKTSRSLCRREKNTCGYYQKDLAHLYPQGCEESRSTRVRASQAKTELPNTNDYWFHGHLLWFFTIKNGVSGSVGVSHL